MIKPLVILVVVLFNGIVCPPPLRQQAQQAQAQDNAQQHNQEATGQQQGEAAQNTEQQGEYDGRHPGYQFAYTKYLEEVVKILESDPKFNERLKNMKEDDIKAGNIADHIDDLPQEVFDKLHKAKFDEIERLRKQIEEQIKVGNLSESFLPTTNKFQLDGGAHNIKMPDHLDVQELEKFHKEDLRKLIQKTVADMNAMDDQRKEDFKQYEMKKQAEEDHKLAQMTPEDREKAKLEHEESIKRHNDHEKLKHPGSKDQLQEVWEESDHLEKDQYDPKTFFALHDLNGDGFWNDFELESLFQLELEKMYNETNPDDDMKERAEEMYRMREHVMKQIDVNQDRMISMEEFLNDADNQNSNPPKQQEAWEDLGQKKVYTDEELQQFEAQYAKQQGWGEHAYDPQQVASDQIHQQPAQQQPQVAQQQVHPAQQQPIQPVNNHAPPPVMNAQPHVQQQQPPQQTPQQPPQQPPQQNLPPVHHEPIQDHTKDPTYGI
ncbi:CRE-NUCB-1 protein [Caenorhabditis remanei]|uniref:CRE-NUCB-1 protein n=1 Tax=Caenorhabditis remanei TaxID=31234 RepID=E3MPI6_CAERE|nr:CRE-NUCB-1 protein [Caenorhabditis remanei]